MFYTHVDSFWCRTLFSWNMTRVGVLSLLNGRLPRYGENAHALHDFLKLSNIKKNWCPTSKCLNISVGKVIIYHMRDLFRVPMLYMHSRIIRPLRWAFCFSLLYTHDTMLYRYEYFTFLCVISAMRVLWAIGHLVISGHFIAGIVGKRAFSNTRIISDNRAF